MLIPDWNGRITAAESGRCFDANRGPAVSDASHIPYGSLLTGFWHLSKTAAGFSFFPS